MSFQAKEESSNEFTKALAGSVALAIPLIQFFYQLFPNSVNDIFLDKRVFFGGSLLTLILSIIVILWFKDRPYFSFRLPFQGKRIKEYNTYLSKFGKVKRLERVNPPVTIDQMNLVSWSVPTMFVLGLIFIFLGLIDRNNIQFFLIMLQATVYSAIVLLVTFVATIIYASQNSIQNYKQNRIRRSARAIGLAIENNAIPELQPVKFVEDSEIGNYPSQYYSVVVSVEGKKYSIVTDTEAEILHSVKEYVAPQPTAPPIQGPKENN